MLMILGSKLAQFAIDVQDEINNLNDQAFHTLAIPKRGHIEAQDAKVIKIQVMCTQVGDYSEEFWVRSIKPIRIGVK